MEMSGPNINSYLLRVKKHPVEDIARGQYWVTTSEGVQAARSFQRDSVSNTNAFEARNGVRLFLRFDTY